jgi:hypothetical protein
MRPAGSTSMTAAEIAGEAPAGRTSSPRTRSDLPDFVTVLTTKGPLATKRIVWAPSATKPTIEPYGNAKVFSISEHAVGSIADLVQLLSRLEDCVTSFVVRGRPSEGIDRNYAYRRARPRTKSDGTVEPATIEPAGHHWIPFDLDSIDCPGWLDPVDDPDHAVEYVVNQLPEEFHGATCWWSFTSGQGIKPGIRIRLFFWADRALADWELKAWLGERVRTVGVPQARWPLKYPVDTAIFAPAQPIYVARPIIIGGPDPVPIRSGIWRGDRDAITPPAITNPKVIAAREPAGRQTSCTYFGGGYETHRSRIGDHEGGDAFHEPVKTAVAAYIAQQGSSADTEWLRADLERAIRAATRDPRTHDDAYVEFRVRDLDTLIPAIVGLQSANETTRPGVEECEPTYSAPVGSVAEARARLAQVARQHVASVIAYAAANATYQVQLKEWEARQGPAF